jgi:hypothetical protein
VNKWERGVDADQNFVLISVPSVLCPDLAPPGKRVLHAYTPGTEPLEFGKALIGEARSTKNSREKDLRYFSSSTDHNIFESSSVLGTEKFKILRGDSLSLL